MAQDCYKLYKTTYKQALADGITDVAATEAAGRAMDNCLKNQALQTPAVSAIVSVPGDAQHDPGPTRGSINRAEVLGTRQK